MRSKDLLMIVVSIAAMVLGSLLPQLADPLRPLPRICLMIVLYLGFLSVGTEALITQARYMPGQVVAFTGVRLLALPLFAFVVFRLLMPEFALGSLLVAASCVGVVAPVFSLMVQANTALILIACLTTALLLPLSLPLLLYSLSRALDWLHLGPLNLPPDLSLSGMTISLCITILVPFAAAFLTRNGSSSVTTLILRHQYPLSITALAISNFSIFCQYADVVQQDPGIVFHALVAACLLGLVMMAAGGALPQRLPPEQKLAFIIGYGTMNNVLMLIVSMEFFSAVEALLAAMYLVPLNLLLLFYRWLSRRWGVESAASPA